ncbi:hypothetical protein Tco_1041807 [Tanacetum coccineum]|uniref:Uncharacterized protein n=1 Tax=Tanacetum coccineum TaxID=301880 RepID=A0ABQ5GJL3_9ASTR
MGDEVGNPSPQSTPQVLPSFEEYTPPVTYPEEVEETLGISMEVEPLDQTKLEDVDISLRDERGIEPPIKPHSPDSFRMKVVDSLTIHTLPSPHVESFYPKGRKTYFLEDKQIPSVGVFDEVIWELLEDIHMTWTHLGKKRDKLATLQQSGFKNCSQSLETAL